MPRITGLAPGTLNALLAYDWPGNVRELGNVVERAVVLSTSDVIGLEVLPEEIIESETRPALPESTGEPSAILRYHDAVAEAKRDIIRDALRRTGNHQTRAAELLGLSQPYLARLIKNLGLR